MTRSPLVAVASTPDHPAAAARDAAAWEDAIVRGGLARALAPELGDPAEREIALGFERAQRGIFVFEELEDQLVARDLWGSAEFLVLNRDSTGRELVAALRRSGAIICQARLVAQNTGCAVLPGSVFHPADARGAIDRNSDQRERCPAFDRRGARRAAQDGTHVPDDVAGQDRLRVPERALGGAQNRLISFSRDAAIAGHDLAIRRGHERDRAVLLGPKHAKLADDLVGKLPLVA